MRTARDDELLEVLTHHVRVLSLQQVARTWWPAADPATALERLRLLAAADHLTITHHLARPEVDLERPLATWQPECVPPNFARVVAAASRRWADPARLTTCVAATRATRVRLADRGGHLPRETEWTHDLHLAQVFLRFRHDLPTRAASWCHEDHAARPRRGRPAPSAGQKRPDAVVTDGLHTTAVEMVGTSYSRAKSEDFHVYCAAQGMAYELW